MANPPVSLDGWIQSLPQELQDQIKDMLITSELPEGPIEVNGASNPASGSQVIAGNQERGAYKPPLGLQIDHKTREIFAKEFYKNGAVIRPRRHVVGEILMTQPYWCARKWLSSLTEPHRQFIRTLQFDIV